MAPGDGVMDPLAVFLGLLKVVEVAAVVVAEVVFWGLL